MVQNPKYVAGGVAGIAAIALLAGYCALRPGPQPPQPQPSPAATADPRQVDLNTLLQKDQPMVVIAANDYTTLTELYVHATSGADAAQKIKKDYSDLLASAIVSAKTEFTLYSVNVAGKSIYVMNPVLTPDPSDGNVSASRKNGAAVVLGIDDPHIESDATLIEQLPYSVDMSNILTFYNPKVDDLYILVTESRTAKLEARGQQNHILVKAPKGHLRPHFNLEALVQAVTLPEDSVAGNIGIDTYDLSRDAGGLDDSVVILNGDGYPLPTATPVPRRPVVFSTPVPRPVQAPTRTPTPFPTPTVYIPEPQATAEPPYVPPTPTYFPPTVVPPTSVPPTPTYIPPTVVPPTPTLVPTPTITLPTATIPVPTAVPPTATLAPPTATATQLPTATPVPSSGENGGGSGGSGGGSGGSGGSPPSGGPPLNNNNDHNDPAETGNDPNGASGAGAGGESSGSAGSR